MLILIWLAGLLGAIRYRCARYWNWMAVLIAWPIGFEIFFSGGGSLDDPAGDGLLAHPVRVLTNDGLGFGIFAVAMLIIYLGGFVVIARKLYLATRQCPPPAHHLARRVAEGVVWTIACIGFALVDMGVLVA